MALLLVVLGEVTLASVAAVVATTGGGTGMASLVRVLEEEVVVGTLGGGTAVANKLFDDEDVVVTGC